MVKESNGPSIILEKIIFLGNVTLDFFCYFSFTLSNKGTISFLTVASCFFDSTMHFIGQCSRINGARMQRMFLQLLMIFPIRAVYCVPAIIYLYFTEDTLLRFARGAEFILMVARIDIRNNYIFPLECRLFRTWGGGAQLVYPCKYIYIYNIHCTRITEINCGVRCSVNLNSIMLVPRVNCVLLFHFATYSLRKFNFY